MGAIVDIWACSRRGKTAGKTLHWATNKRGQYILHVVIDSTGRWLSWEDTKRTINQILIRDRGDALRMLLTGRYATRMGAARGDSPNLISPKRIMLELADGTIRSLSDATSMPSHADRRKTARRSAAVSVRR
jgi:hypothetical protein